jgi:hypothetical protein
MMAFPSISARPRDQHLLIAPAPPTIVGKVRCVERTPDMKIDGVLVDKDVTLDRVTDAV